MPRAKRGNKRLEKRKKILALAKGYRGTKSKLYRSAKESVERGLNFAYTGQFHLRGRDIGIGRHRRKAAGYFRRDRDTGQGRGWKAGPGSSLVLK